MPGRHSRNPLSRNVARASFVVTGKHLPKASNRPMKTSASALRRRVKRPTGSCDRVLIGNSKTVAFSATTAEFSCGNFEAAPPKPRTSGGGFVTIWQNGRILWQGDEENIPARFLQQDLDL
jgi:hypothetical protein